MSNLTANDTRGLMEAYAAVYDQDLREQLEEDREVERVGFQVIENASNVLFSLGYDVNDLINYFEEASVDTIIEDFISFTEGQAYISESFIVSNDYIQEQFNFLNELLEATVTQSKPPQSSKVTQSTNPKVTQSTNPKVTSNYSVPASQMGPKPAPVNPVSAKPAGFLQRVGDFAKTAMTKVGNFVSKNVPGGKFLKTAVTKPKVAARFLAQSPVGKFAGRILPGAGAALYGMDAVGRAKKGDYAGAALSGLGAGLSLVPGVGALTALAPAGVQMATDALGLTGDKSKKGPTGKTAPVTPPSLKAKQDYAKSKGKYYSSSDQKTYANYNDALAARNSRLGKPAPTPSTPSSTPSTPSSTPQKPKGATPGQLTPGGRKGNEELEGKTFPTAKTKGGTEYEVRTPTSAEMEASRKAGGGEAGVKAAVERSSKLMGGPEGPGKIDPKSVEADLKAANDPTKQKPAPPNTALAAEEERRRKAAAEKAAAEKAAAGTTKESYDAYDIVLEYLISGGHVESISEAHYVMLEMDSETIQSIVEQMTVNVADVKGGTQAAKNAAAGMKDKFGKPMYKPGVGVSPDFKLIKGV